jgi:hypothetical protein
VAFRLWAVSGDIRAGERIVFRARRRIDLMKLLQNDFPNAMRMLVVELGLLGRRDPNS